MKVNVECNEISFEPETMSFAEIGLIAVLNNISNQGVLSPVDAFGENNIKYIKDLLLILEKKNILKLEEEDGILNIKDAVKTEFSMKNLSRSKKIQIVYQLDEKKYSSIVERSNDQASFKYNLVNICYEYYKPRSIVNSTIDSEEDYVAFLQNITPFELIVSHQKTLKRKDFEAMYDLLCGYDLNLELFNFAIDYAIVTSNYYNLSYDFVRVLLDSWKKHEIGDVGSALNLIKAQKEATAKKGNKYSEPVYDETVEQDEVEVDIDNLFRSDDVF